MLGTEAISLCITAALWYLTIMLSKQYSRLGKICQEQEKFAVNCNSLPEVAIVVLAQEEVDKLEKHLPLFLQQIYPTDFQVIVIDIHSSDGTLKLLEKLEAEYPLLSHTSIPASARDISMQRLAMTLGLKTACTDWVIFTQANCFPESNEWLANFMNTDIRGKNAIIGMTKYACCNNWLMKKRQFFRLWQQMLWIPFAEKHHPYRADDTILAYRKEFFFSHNGFSSDSKLLVGAATLLVNKNISCQHCAVSVSKKAHLLQDNPLPHTWMQEEVFFMETRRHTRYKCMYRTWYALKILIPMLYTLSTIISCIMWYQNSIVMGILMTLYVCTYIVRDIAFNKTTRQLNIKSYHFTLPYLCSIIPIWDIQAWLKWRFTNKKAFRKKFV